MCGAPNAPAANRTVSGAQPRRCATRGATENEPRSRSGNDVAFGGNALVGIEQLPRSVERRRILLEIDHEHGGDVRQARQRERSNALVMRFARSGYPRTHLETAKD